MEREKSGQSLVEFALVLPILLIALLGAANLGLAIRAQLQLAQLSQQAAQYLVHNPGLATKDTSCSTIPSYCNLVAYMNRLSSYHLDPLEVSLTIGTSSIASGATVQQDTVRISYPYKVIMPGIGLLPSAFKNHCPNQAPLTSADFCLSIGATGSSVAATHAPQLSSFAPNPCEMGNSGNIKCPDFTYNGNNKTPLKYREIFWQAPPEAASPLSVPVSYCITRSIGGDPNFYAGDTTDSSPSLVNTVANKLNCIAPHTSSHQTNGVDDLYFVDDDTTHYSGALSITYKIYAIQANGLLSPFLALTEAPPGGLP